MRIKEVKDPKMDGRSVKFKVQRRSHIVSIFLWYSISFVSNPQSSVPSYPVSSFPPSNPLVSC